MKAAIAYKAFNDAEDIDQERQEFMDELLLRAMKLQQEQVVWREKLHPQVRGVVGKLHGPLISELYHECKFDEFDECFLGHCFGGFPAVGQLPATFYDTEVATHMSPTISRQELVDLRVASNERIVSTLWGSGHDEEMLAKTKKEAEQGWLNKVVQAKLAALSFIHMNDMYRQIN